MAAHNYPVRVLGVLQARMTSRRFPGKVLQPILGEPMILHQLRRLERSSLLDGLVVATSLDPSDDPLVDAVASAGYQTFRGPLDDVLARYVKVIDHYSPSVVVRLTADCPLSSPQVIDQITEGFLESEFDYRSNTLKPTYPDGLDVEIFRSSVLSDLEKQNLDPDEREHVTLGIYRRPDKYRLSSIERNPDLSHLRWTVDFPEDLEFIEWVYASLGQTGNAFDIDDVLKLLYLNPAKSRTTSNVGRNCALNGLHTGAMTHKPC